MGSFRTAVVKSLMKNFGISLGTNFAVLKSRLWHTLRRETCGYKLQIQGNLDGVNANHNNGEL